MHGVQTDDPTELPSPAPHGRQASEDVDPDEGLYRPVAQGVQEAAEMESLYSPTGQLLQPSPDVFGS